jgi:hypothetical protein
MATDCSVKTRKSTTVCKFFHVKSKRLVFTALAFEGMKFDRQILNSPSMPVNNTKKNSLVNNINARKASGTSRSKKNSTVSKKAYKKMQDNWGKKK